MKAERIAPILRDVGSVLVGLSVIVHQTWLVPPGQASEVLLLAAVSLLGVPAGAGLLSQRSSGGSSTTGSGSTSPPPDSPPPPSSPSSPASSGAGSP